MDSFWSENERFNINSFSSKSMKSTVLLGFLSWCALIECDRAVFEFDGVHERLK